MKNPAFPETATEALSALMECRFRPVTRSERLTRGYAFGSTIAIMPRFVAVRSGAEVTFYQTGVDREETYKFEAQ